MKGEFRIKKQKIRVNERIYADEVRLISENKEQIGVVSVKEALSKAQRRHRSFYNFDFRNKKRG